jgi:bifunctional DNase/RNase
MGSKFAQLNIWKAFAIIGLWLATSTCSQAGSAVNVSPAAAPDSEPLTQVTVYRLIVDPASQQPVVTLVDSDEKRAFPIWIGLSEARAIHSELQGMKHPRPLTHDLLARIIDKVDGKIHRVIITHAKENVFYATLVIKTDDSLIEIDARPSDSIVLALKFNAPIYVTRRLFEKMSMPLETPKETGKGYGLNMQEITPELAKYLALESNLGVMVSAVRPGSQADKDGIQPGDILVELAGQQIADVISVKDILANRKGSLQAKIIRAKQTLNFTFHLK